jgi:pantoate--beta-alanine ligase
MASDLNMPVAIKVMPTVREKDGLALSSRNAYLSQDQRKGALVLCDALALAGDLISRGEGEAGVIIRKMKRCIRGKKSVKIEYVAIVDADTLRPVKRVSLVQGAVYLVALAVWIGKTRLIDNIIIGAKPGNSNFVF